VDEGSYLSQIIDTVIPCPLLATILFPVVKCRFAAGDPREVVGTAASSQNLTAGIGFLNALVVVTLDHGRLVRPVILTSSQVKGLCRSGNVFNLLWVAARRQRWRDYGGTDPVMPAHLTPASITNTRTFGSSAKRPATVFPAVPPAFS
jgi:hypothetical protein